MNAQIIPFPVSKTRIQPVVTIDGEFAEDVLAPELFDSESDADDLVHELSLYIQSQNDPGFDSWSNS
ncbi:MAG: hypothetical protein WBQ60_04160 [Asticcacaulis sp.]